MNDAAFAIERARRFGWALAASAVFGLGSGSAGADPIAIFASSINMFRDYRGINDVGSTPGDRLQYGANIVGGSSGTSLSAFYAPQNLTDPAALCAPLAVNPNFCSNSVLYASTNPASAFFGVPRTAAPWTFTFTRPGETPLVVQGPSLAGADFRVPQPTSVTISGSGATPTVSWQLPSGYVPDGFRVQIYDKSVIRANGSADIIHTVALGKNDSSYTLPSTLSSGQTLKQGGNYSINFEIVETRDNADFGGSNAQIISRSQSWFSFTPLNNQAPPNVHLPEVGADTNPNDNRGAAYQFSIEQVGPNSVTFIDPFVATGYDFKTGVGDPNFLSVILPNVGDGVFDLVFDTLNGPDSHVLNSGDEFFFPTGGVAAFSVRGIETSAGLDPNDVTAFVTGLKFVSQGRFTGTMTPIVTFIPDAAVPLPGTLALLGLGWLGIVGTRRNRR